MVRRRAWLALASLLVVLVGSACYVATTSILAQPYEAMLATLFSFSGHIFVQGADGGLGDYDALAEDLRRIPHVELVVPMIERPAGVSTTSGKTGAIVRGVEAADLKRLPGVAEHIESGTLASFGETDEIILGGMLAEKLHATVGGTVTMIAAEHGPPGILPSTRRCEVLSVFRTGVPNIDSTYALMPLAQAQAFFRSEGRVDTIVIVLDDPDRVDDVRRAIEAMSREPLILTDWRETNRASLAALRTETRIQSTVVGGAILFVVLGIIFAMIIVVEVRGIRADARS